MNVCNFPLQKVPFLCAYWTHTHKDIHIWLQRSRYEPSVLKRRGMNQHFETCTHRNFISAGQQRGKAPFEAVKACVHEIFHTDSHVYTVQALNQPILTCMQWLEHSERLV